MPDATNFDDQSIQDVPRFKRFKGKKGETKLIFFFSSTVLKDTSHFKEGYGYFRCLATAPGVPCPACAAGLKANVRLGTHILVYDTELDGRPKQPLNFEIQAFIFGTRTYTDLRNIRQEWSDQMFKRDFKVTCSNDDFQHLAFIPCQDCHFLKKIEEIKAQDPQKAKEIVQEIKQRVDSMDIAKVIAPSIDIDTMRKVLTGEVVSRFSKNQGIKHQSTAVSSSFVGVGVSGGASTRPAQTASADETKSLLDELSK